MAKKFDPKAKAKRQKIIAAVGGVILLGVLAFQVPRTLKMLHQSNANAADTTPTATTSSTTATGPIAAPSLGGGNATASATSNVSSDGVNDPDVLPAPQSGQLLAFSRFRSKDPFSQQIGLNCAAGGSQQGCPSTSPGTGTTSGGTKPPVKPPARTLTPTVTPSTGRAARLTSAVISVNGASQTVRVGASFPASAPTFKLVSVTKTSAQVGIAGGSLASGNQTVTLKLNKQLTLMNTADGTRYVLRLLSVK